MKNITDSRILIIGGHFTAALSVYEKLKDLGYTDFVWAGHKYTMLKDKEPSMEYKEITKLGIPFFDIKAGKLYRYISWLGFISLLRIPVGFVQSFFMILSTRPALVLSFGGYLAVPVSLSAALFRIPIITHEQTVSTGLSNKIIGKAAKKILIAWKESADFFPQEKTIFTGNPIRKEVFINDRKFIDFHNDLPTLLVIGGNQGSHTLNMLIKTHVEELEKRYNIIHQTGSNTVYNDYDALLSLTKKYPNYQIFKGIWGNDFGRALNQSDVVISRSGANTVYELAALHKKAILIPLSYAVNNEQYKNAKILEHAEIGVIIQEKELVSNKLEQTIANLIEKPVDNNSQIVTLDAADQIATIVDASLKKAKILNK